MKTGKGQKDGGHALCEFRGAVNLSAMFHQLSIHGVRGHPLMTPFHLDLKHPACITFLVTFTLSESLNLLSVHLSGKSLSFVTAMVLTFLYQVSGLWISLDDPPMQQRMSIDPGGEARHSED